LRAPNSEDCHATPSVSTVEYEDVGLHMSEPVPESAEANKPIRPGKLRIGTAGFSSNHWAGHFYPPRVKKSEDQLEAYQDTFSAVEINGTFYGMPAESTISQWKRRSADGFEMSLKVPKSVTHDGQLDSPEALEGLWIFVNRAKALGTNLGPVLFQCPRSLTANVQKLIAVSKVLEEVPSMRVAMEFRDESWFADEKVQSFMREKNWALVDHPNSIGRATAGAGTSQDSERTHYALQPLRGTCTASFAYIRLHGNCDDHTYRYSNAELQSIAAELHNMRMRGVDVYCFMLNDDDTAAMPQNARQLLKATHELQGEPLPKGPGLARQRSLKSFFSGGGGPPEKKLKAA